MSTILVTGGAGRLGANVAFGLRERGHIVRVMDIEAADFSPFEDREGFEIIKGDIRNGELVKKSVSGCSMVFHLAAVLPPASEKDRTLTMSVNVEGTRAVLHACAPAGSIPLAFSSSVSTYGDTSTEMPPVQIDHSQVALNIYPESKIASEKLVKEAGVPYTILRIAGIAVPAFLDPPDPWPFMRNQRVEFVAINDLVTALVNLVDNSRAQGKIFNLAGGSSWQMTGEEYARRYCQTLQISFDSQKFYDKPGWLDWYDTPQSQAILKYQNTSFDQFHAMLKTAMDAALGD
ncbi:MAG: NAD(P)-dependent oxidoreductase [Candidatus Lindowbacteria bacterium]|nr:NAD(P)-dependent oxidoreductase [Candidatus Lindowbacteria bacterium]